MASPRRRPSPRRLELTDEHRGALVDAAAPARLNAARCLLKLRGTAAEPDGALAAAKAHADYVISAVADDETRAAAWRAKALLLRARCHREAGRYAAADEDLAAAAAFGDDPAIRRERAALRRDRGETVAAERERMRGTLGAPVEPRRCVVS